jgi:hypothetical protein
MQAGVSGSQHAIAAAAAQPVDARPLRRVGSAAARAAAGCPGHAAQPCGCAVHKVLVGGQLVALPLAQAVDQRGGRGQGGAAAAGAQHAHHSQQHGMPERWTTQQPGRVTMGGHGRPVLLCCCSGEAAVQLFRRHAAREATELAGGVM